VSDVEAARCWGFVVDRARESGNFKCDGWASTHEVSRARAQGVPASTHARVATDHAPLRQLEVVAPVLLAQSPQLHSGRSHSEHGSPSAGGEAGHTGATVGPLWNCQVVPPQS